MSSHPNKMKTTFRVRFIIEGKTKQFPKVGKSYLSSLLDQIKRGVINNLSIKRNS